MKWFISISFLFLFQFHIGQTIQLLEDSLISILKKVQTEKNTQLVEKYNNHFKATLDLVIKHPESFEYEFDSLSNFMSTVKSPDGLFRMFNWNIQQKNQTQFYECWINKEDGSVIKLKDHQKTIPEIEFATLSENSWFGALYYKIIPVIKKNKTYYTLLGWDGNDMFSNKKIIEILEFKKSKLQFGNSMFVYPNQRTKKRVVLQYNKQSYMSLKHDKIRKENYIIFDHLVPTSPHLKDFPDWYVTDLSFDAFKWDGARWTYIKDFDAKSLKILRRPFNDPNK